MQNSFIFFVYILVLGFFVIFSGTCQAGTDLVYQQANMDEVKVRRNITYKTEQGKGLMLDVYYSLEKAPATKGHTVVLVHGRGPESSYKDTALYNSWGRLMAVNGFNAVTFNWRPGHSPDDITDLSTYIRANAEELKINGNSISFFVFSLGVKDGVREALLADQGFIKSIIVYYGRIDQSILELITDKEFPPFLIVMAAKDRMIPVNANDDFINQLKKGVAGSKKLFIPAVNMVLNCIMITRRHMKLSKKQLSLSKKHRNNRRVTCHPELKQLIDKSEKNGKEIFWMQHLNYLQSKDYPLLK